ncbi:hypothetical protein CHISP_2794 [Chitinispirillum alkaliphilum]|nr:hypothetical protein CHISP_2794 [Chitinispirillum alkaliphilum]
MFLGLEGAGVMAAYLLSICAALACVIYGILNWNQPKDENETREIEEEIEWEQHDPEVMEEWGSRR